uniref:Uncharacterized protein n=1 Tax=viral metagenome TaxID=1070528 RepID=A0A6C0JUW2_9ZZZZ
MNHLPLDMTRWLSVQEKERLEYAEALVRSSKCLLDCSCFSLQLATKNVTADNEKLSKEGFIPSRFDNIVTKNNDQEFIRATKDHENRTAEYIAALELVTKTLYELTILIYNRQKDSHTDYDSPKE